MKRVTQILALTNNENEENKNIFYVMYDFALTKCILLGKRLDTGEYTIKIGDRSLIFPKGTKFYTSEASFRSGCEATEQTRMIYPKDSDNLFLNENNELVYKRYKFGAGEPEEINDVVKQIFFDSDGSVIPCVDLEHSYRTRLECLEDNDYTIEEDGVKRVVKSKKRAVALEEDQLAMIQELKDLLKKMSDNGIQATVDTLDYVFYFFNTRRLKEVGCEWDCPPKGFEESDYIEPKYMSKVDLRFDIENMECFGYYGKVK